MSNNQSQIGSGKPVAGILNLHKPAGLTSHDVVDRVRRILGQRRVGHAGTLDPLATGVLVICVGWATRLSEYLVEGSKQYTATVRLGIVTDTFDAEGTVTATKIVDVDEQTVRIALREFVGPIEQQAPAYSAIKQAGTPLHKRVRRGESVDAPTRPVIVHDLSLRAWSPPVVVLDVACSKGTYVRSLAHDLGARLGCGAHLVGLIRTRSGPFRLEDAVTLDELAELANRGQARRAFYPLERALPEIGLVRVGADQIGRIGHGQPIEGPRPDGGNGLALAVSMDGEALAVLRYSADLEKWQPGKVFV